MTKEKKLKNPEEEYSLSSLVCFAGDDRPGGFYLGNKI